MQSIRNFVDVRPHPTVVRLGESLDAAWIRETYRRTDDVDRHLSALRRALAEPRGTGAFLIGHYGAGKSHFLAWVAQTLRAGEWGDDAPDVVAVSLVNFPSEARLEAIVGSALGVTLGTGDRRESWAALMGRHANGLLLVIDELSEFLRSKPDARRFNEDVRFLQFMGEWAQGGRFWVMAAVQEAIEHIGDLESGHYRKIKDRFPLRLHLTPGHVRDLIAHSVLVKRPGYDDAVATLVRKLEAALPGADVAWHELAAICPLHPATLELLEEVRDRFSQTRGVVDFVTARLAGDAARGLEPFVDRPWGELVTPDHIVEHFRDVFELQSEFQPFAQRVFPWYAKHLEALFPRPKPRALALRLIRLLTLVHLSPTRECLGADEATSWLLFAATRLEPERNRAIVERALDALVERGRYVKRVGDAWRLDLADDGGEGLERLVQRELAELPGDEVVGELLADAFAARGSAFDPAALPRERWLQRRFRWCFHERIWSLYVGHDLPPTVDGPAICVRLPWGESASVPSAYTVRPRRLVLDPPLRELAALVRLRTRPLPPEMMRRLIQRVHERRELWSTALRAAYADATIETPDGAAQPGVPLGASDVTDRWLDAHAELVLRRLYPRFESFAPTAGPLAKSHFVAFLEFVEAHGIGERTTNDRVDQLREAYLVPMGLLERRAGGLQVPARLDRHELVRLVLDMAAEHVAPRAVYRRLSEPVHGLVPDQIHVLLVFLLAVGEVDLRKADRSMRAMYAAAPLPDMYDRIAPGRALGAEQLRALEQLGAGLHVNLPRQWTVSAQRRVVAAVRGALEKRLGRLRPVCDRLESDSEAVRAIAELAATAAALDAEDPIEGVEAFLDRAQSVARFLTRLDDLGGLPERVDRQLAEGRRFEHLLRQPGLESVARELGAPPGLDDGEGFDRWLARAQDLHAAHVDHYRRAHDAWWHARDDAAVWHWSPPAVARARHVGLIDDLRALTDLQARARAQRCGGLGNLEFQARCACGFDGETAMAGEPIATFDDVRRRFERALARFFASADARARVDAWSRVGIDEPRLARPYADGEARWPEVADVARFDEHLAGLELVHEIALDDLAERLGGRTWAPDELLAAFGRLMKGSDRVRVARPSPDLRDDVVEWCVALSLRTGTPVPRGLGRSSSPSGPGSQPTVGPDALARLEDLGLAVAVVDGVLRRLLDRTIDLPPAGACSPLVRAVGELIRPSVPQDPEDLAALAAGLYSHHRRLMSLAAAPWVERLDAVAHADSSHLSHLPIPDALAVLDALPDHQVLVLDAFGLPLLGAVRDAMGDLLPDWTLGVTHFGDVGADTSTDAFYRRLAQAGSSRPIVKVNAIDATLHARPLDFSDLVRVALAELEVSLRGARRRLDPARGVVVTADHGFRLGSDGRWTHGGDSTLERIVPLVTMAPY